MGRMANPRWGRARGRLGTTRTPCRGEHQRAILCGRLSGLPRISMSQARVSPLDRCPRSVAGASLQQLNTTSTTIFSDQAPARRIRLRSIRLIAVLSLLTGLAVPSRAQRHAGPIPEQGQPVTLAGALQYDSTSRVTGRPYRLTIRPPVHADSSRRYPVLYVLDGTAWSATASEVTTVFAGR